MYPFKEIEPKWQAYWQEHSTFHTSDSSEKKKKYILDMFTYPSAAGLHTGHTVPFTATDIMSRYLRMKDYEVLHPTGWDAFGLPAENYAIKQGMHPKKSTDANIANFKRQVQLLGFSYDWDREIDTSSPEYYKWTQWLFLQLYDKGLAVKEEAPVNWCTNCHTVLANEQVINGTCERCKNPVVQKELSQWFFKITEFAEDLLSGLDRIDWPDSLKNMQRNWIGKSEGAEIIFKVKEFKEEISTFTTRADTLFGVTYVVLSPEHPFIESHKDKIANYEEVHDYVLQASHKSEIERTHLEKEKTGVPVSGVHVVNPANGEEVQVWVADYVLSTYGTGAVMAVPAHDERDYEFAKKYNLPIQEVVAGGNIEEAAYVDDGDLVNSGKFDGMKNREAIEKICKHVKAEMKTTYRLRDWLISRQRYWGAPIPIINCEKCGEIAVPEIDLPVLLPKDVDFKPTGESPLEQSESFHDVKCPKCGVDARRESDTMDTFVCSSWYFLRYTSAQDTSNPFTKDLTSHWLPVDLYVGGPEHAVMHLLYARFITKALYSMDYLSFDEPFEKYRLNGMVLGTDGDKMSKSKGNVINPDEIIDEYGADVLRLFVMFMSPLPEDKPWNASNIIGQKRFLDKMWSVVNEHIKSSGDDVESETVTRLVHKTIKKVSEDIENLQYNTAISALMVLVNEMHKNSDSLTCASIEKLVLLLSPFAPHISEELWSLLGHEETLAYEAWPKYDEAMIIDSMITLIVQVNGKVRDQIEVTADISGEDAKAQALSLDAAKKWLEGKEPKKVVYVKGRLVNIVV